MATDNSDQAKLDSFANRDLGGLEAVLLVDRGRQRVILDFLKPLTFVSMTKAEALAFARALIEKAETLK